MRWWNRLSLRARIFLILSALMGITLSGGAVMIWYTYQMDALFSDLVDTDVAALEKVEELEIELVKQKGYASYFFIEGDDLWLRRLDEHRHAFRERLKEVDNFICCDREKEILGKIEAEYVEYVRLKDQVISLYREGNREEGAVLHEKVRDHFERILALSGEFRGLYKKRIEQQLSESRTEARRFRTLAATAMSATVFLGALFALLLVRQILEPIRKLALVTDSFNGMPKASRDEVAELSNHVHGLIENVGQTRTELLQSRELLIQSEKMAVMGKLAADVAHSIRNPMTSIKMRLFSLERSLDLSPTQKEDLEVVSEEMRRLDNTVRAFLEFSRPPKLKTRSLNISEIFDATFQLLSHQLERAGVEVERPQRHSLPEIKGDPELLKEVLVNLIVNSVDSMPGGGKIVVTGEEVVAERVGRAVLIRISDTGPGIPRQLVEKVFEPFFSTKEDGTGLGLPIVKRIIEEHDGHIELDSGPARGATFIITLPIKEETP